MLLHRRRKQGTPATLELLAWAGHEHAAPRGAAPPLWHGMMNAASRSWHHAYCAFRTRFAQHGGWIARHQRRTILLCNLVIASLFYPAVVMYLLTTSEDPTARAVVCADRHAPGAVMAPCVAGAWTPSNIWDMALASLSDVGGTTRARLHDATFPVHDLRLVWDETPSLEVVDTLDAHSVPTVHVAQVLVTTDAIRRGNGPPYGVLEPHLLLAAHEFQRALDRLLLARDACIRPNQTEACLVLSPLAFWGDAAAIHADGHPAKSYTGSPVRAVMTPPVAPVVPQSPLPLLYSTTLASRWPYLPLFSRAEYLVLTYFLQAPVPWAELVSKAAASVGDATVHVPPAPSLSTVLQYKPLSQTRRPTIHYAVIAGGYLLLSLFIFRGLVQMRRLHSRFGIAFTGSVQLVLDLIMSLSVCSLLGIRLTAVPWSILPFVIVVVGSESMLFMIRTITSTPVTMSVHARIAYGLSLVAGPITFSAIADVGLLCVFGWLVPLEGVQQFVLFTTTALVADYFMQMTFFVTVLSIDMQRLELAEVLVQGPAPAAPAADAVAPQIPALRPRSATALMMHTIRAVRHARSAFAALSMIAAVAAIAALVLTCAPEVVRGVAKHLSADDLDTPLEHYSDAELDMSPYGAFWRALNPARMPHVRMVLEPWALASFAGHGIAAHTPPGPWLEHLFYDRRGATLFLILLFVVGPIAGTMGILSIVLRYLQHNTDLIESRAQHAGDDIELRHMLGGSQASATRGDALIVRVDARVDAVHNGPALLVAGARGVLVSSDGASLRLERHGAPPAVTSLAAMRAECGAIADASPVSALTATSTLLVLGQRSGRVSVWTLPSLQPVLDAARASDGTPLAPVQQVAVLAADHVASLHRDGRLWTWDTEHGTSWRCASADRAAAPPDPAAAHAASAWTAAEVDDDSADSIMAATSASGHLVVWRVENTRALVLAHVHAPSAAPVRCTALLRAAAEEESTRAPPRRHTASPTHWLVAGDQRGALYLWGLDNTAAQTAGEPASLTLPASDGPVVRMRRTGASLLVQTANHVWLVAVHADGPRLALQSSWSNARGAADVFPVHAPKWMLGVRRAAEGGAARWELWRVCLKRAVAAPAPPVECTPLALESLIRTGVHEAIAHGHMPSARLPLLTTRIDRLVRGASCAATQQWIVPFGSVLLCLVVEGI